MDKLPLAWAVPTPSLCICPDVLSAPGPIGSAPPTSPVLPSAPPLKAHPHQAEVLGSWGRGLRTGTLGARLPNRSGRRAGPWADVAALQCLGDAGRVASLDPGLKSAPDLETLALTPTCGFHSLAHCAGLTLGAPRPLRTKVPPSGVRTERDAAPHAQGRGARGPRCHLGVAMHRMKA